VLANRLRGGETIGLRHLQIHHDQVELVRPCGLDGRNSVQRRLALAATLSQQTHRDGGVYFIVLGDQHPFPREYARSGSKLHGQVNRKSAAAAELAFQPDPAAHRGDDFLRDRESESQTPRFCACSCRRLARTCRKRGPLFPARSRFRCRQPQAEAIRRPGPLEAQSYRQP